VAHPSLNSAGGGERVCLSLVEALRKEGHKVTLVTVDRTDWNRLKKILDQYCPGQEHSLLPSLPKASSPTMQGILLLGFYFVELLSLKLLKKDRLLISTCGEKVNSIADIVYVNGMPLRCAFKLPGIGVKRKCYSKLYNLLLKTVDRLGTSTIVSNSRFNQQTIRRCIRQEALVVYPPINLRRFVAAGKNGIRKNTVVSVSRFLPEQNLEYIPNIAEIVQDANFLIIGPSGATSNRVLEKLREMITKLNVDDRTEVLTNISSQRFLKALLTAKVFLRTLPNEPFGMSVVEAMAAGCVPVVPRDGGSWFDILDQKQGEYGYSYGSLKEAANVIKMLLENDDLRMEVSARAVKRAMDFDSSAFEKKILRIVEEVYSRKSGLSA